jgi:phage protein D
MFRRPIVRVWGPSGRDLAGIWGQSLVSVKVTDNRGYESDTAEIVLRAEPPGWSFPPKGTLYRVELAWADGGPAFVGQYTVQRVGGGGDPGSGTTLRVTCRAADMVDKLKEVGSTHYDQKTAGDIFKDIASKAGLSAVVAPEIAGIQLPYRLRWQQSAIDFATALGDDVGAMVKAQMGRLVVTKRGEGKSAGGSALPPVEVRYDPNYRFEAEIEPRPQYSEMGGDWYDPAQSERKREKVQPGYSAGRHALMHPYPSQGEAKLGAEAAGREHGRNSGSGSFEMPGNPLAVAEAPVICSGFGADIDGTEWVCSSAEHVVEPEKGWITTVQVETKGSGDAKKK